MSQLRTLESAVGAEVVIAGRRCVNFGGSSYLGLAAQPQILEAGIAALQECGSGYQFARQYQLASRGHQDAETQAAAFFGSQAALFLPTGYYFGLVAITAMRGAFDAVFFDERAHDSLRDAIAAFGLASHAFRHLDAEDLRVQIKRHLRAGGKPLVASDGMYSTFGEIAPLDELMQVMAPYGGRLLVDESHSFGVLGEHGRGASEHHSLPTAAVLGGGSTGKALGVLGGIIPASAAEVAQMRAVPAVRSASVGLPAAAAMLATSLRYVREHPELLQRLRANTAYMKAGLRKLGFEVAQTIAPVATFVTDPSKCMQSLQQQLLAEGIYVLHSNYIGAGARGVIRCGIFADHTFEHIDRLLDALRRLV